MKSTMKNKKARKLHIGSVALKLPWRPADELMKRGCLYECGDRHDLHLTPDHKWSVDDVAEIILCVVPPEMLRPEPDRRPTDR